MELFLSASLWASLEQQIMVQHGTLKIQASIDRGCNMFLFLPTLIMTIRSLPWVMGMVFFALRMPAGHGSLWPTTSQLISIHPSTIFSELSVYRLILRMIEN